MEVASEVGKCVLIGVRDSIAGAWPVITLIKNNDKIKKKLLQCFLLNGVILGLSILIFDYGVLPVVQYLAGWMYGIVSDPSESSILSWLGTILTYVFNGFWVLPIFWISKPINSIWFQDIASLAFDESKKQQKKPNSRSTGDGRPLSQLISHLIADFLFSIVMELLFLVQAMLVGLIPGIGTIFSLLHMAMLYALYSFEYKWFNEGWRIRHRVNYVEKNWPYFLGFGLPLAILTALPSSLVISACIFAVLFPIFILSANEAKPKLSSLSQVPIFKIAVTITNKLFNRTPQVSSSTRPS